MNDAPQTALARTANGYAVEGEAEEFPHGLNLFVRLPFEPRQDCVTREKVGPTFEGFGNFDAEFEGALHDGRSWIGSENVGPELGARKLSADIHHKADRCAPFHFAF